MSREFPTYRQSPLYWEPFWRNFVAILKPLFCGFKVPRDMVLGACGAVGKTLCEVVLGIGAASDWQRHHIKVLIVTIVWSFSVLIGDAAWRTIAALWKTCRLRRFQEISLLFAYGAVVEGLLIIYVWHGVYVSEPHFVLIIPDKGMIISNVYDAPGASPSYPTTSVIFPEFILSNKYVPAIPVNWKLIAKFSNGQELVGVPSRSWAAMDDGTHIMGNKFWIWNALGRGYVASGKGGLGYGNQIAAPAEFRFDGVPEQILISPDVEYFVEFDVNGKRVQTKAPPRGVQLMRQLPQ